jgi:hypothetical protein
MGVNGLKEGLGEAGELGVEFEVDAGGEVGEAFEEALDVGVGADVLAGGVDGEAPGDFRVFSGELRRGLAEVAELVVVVVYETLIHW